MVPAMLLSTPTPWSPVHFSLLRDKGLLPHVGRILPVPPSLGPPEWGQPLVIHCPTISSNLGFQVSEAETWVVASLDWTHL